METIEEWKLLDWRGFGVEVGVRAQKSQSGLINCLNLRSRSVEVEVEKVETVGVGVVVQEIFR